MAIDPYTSDDYAAFLAYAGPPPPQSTPVTARVIQRQTGAALRARLDYIGECDKFCAEYFGHLDTDVEEWVEFYQAFNRWFTIWEGMANEIDGDGKKLRATKQDT